MTMSTSTVSFQSTRFSSENFFFKSNALFLVLFLIKIFSTFILFKATIIDGTTPPAPIIRTFFLFALYLQCLIESSKPAISVL